MPRRGMLITLVLASFFFALLIYVFGPIEPEPGVAERFAIDFAINSPSLRRFAIKSCETRASWELEKTVFSSKGRKILEAGVTG